MMNKIWSYIAVFLLGGLIVALYALNAVKPSIIAESYIEKLEQNVKKLKQSGENNTQDITHTVQVATHAVQVEPEPKKKRKFLRIFKRKEKL